MNWRAMPSLNSNTFAKRWREHNYLMSIPLRKPLVIKQVNRYWNLGWIMFQFTGTPVVGVSFAYPIKAYLEEEGE